MAQAIKRYDGNVVIIPAPYDVEVNDVVTIGAEQIGVAQTAGLAGEDISVEIVGVQEIIPARDGDAFEIGMIAYWDKYNKVLCNTDEIEDGGVEAGLVLSTKPAGVTGTVLVKIG